MPNWPKDNQADRNAFYGDTGQGEIAGQMVAVIPPFAVYYGGKRVKNIQFHKKAALPAALNEIWDAGRVLDFEARWDKQAGWSSTGYRPTTVAVCMSWLELTSGSTPDRAAHL